MKRIINTKPILAIITIVLFAMAFKACKKADNNFSDIRLETAKANLLKEIKEKYGNLSAAVVMPIDKQATDYYYKDASGKMVDLYNNTGKADGQGPNGPNPNCQYTCNTATSASQLYITANLDYAQRFYICESSTPTSDKSTVRVKWTVSVPFTISGAIAMANTTSSGYLKFTPSTGSPVIYQVSFSQMTFTNLGTAPGCTTNTLFKVEYDITQVPNNDFASGTTISAALDLANDCNLTGNLISIGYVNGPTENQNAYLPCNRVDKVWTYGGTPAIALGNRLGISCTPPSGFQNIDYHQLEYRKVTSSTSLTWTGQDATGTSTVYWGIPSSSSGTNPVLDPFQSISLPQITSGSGTWLIRYRNVKTNSCDIIYATGSLPNGNWGSDAVWVTDAIQY